MECDFMYAPGYPLNIYERRVNIHVNKGFTKEMIYIKYLIL